jgi:hypothetical protein
MILPSLVIVSLFEGIVGIWWAAYYALLLLAVTGLSAVNVVTLWDARKVALTVVPFPIGPWLVCL